MSVAGTLGPHAAGARAPQPPGRRGGPAGSLASRPPSPEALLELPLAKAARRLEQLGPSAEPRPGPEEAAAQPLTAALPCHYTL